MPETLAGMTLSPIIGGVPPQFAPRLAPYGTAADLFARPAAPLADSLRQAALASRGQPAEFPRALAGGQEPMFGGELFEKIIVSPRKKELGFVLSANQFPVDVWNAFSSALQEMTAIEITGSGGLSIANPFGLPLAFGPFQARSFQATVPEDGDAQIANTAVFVFTGQTGTDLDVSGTRITLFTPDPDWSEPFKELQEYLTQIMTAYGGREQRVQLRTIPRPRLQYRVMTLDSSATAAMDAMLWGWGARVYGVPFWPDARPITARVKKGDTVVSLASTLYLKFAPGGLMMLWRDVLTAEALSVAAVGATTVTLNAPAQNDWAADGQSYIVPVLSGRLPAEVQIDRLADFAAQADCDFACEVV